MIETTSGGVDGSGRDRETRRELAKLTANYFNAIAASVFAIGGVAPIVAYLTGQLSVAALQVPLALSAASLVVSLVAHLGARYVLRREFRR